MSDSRPIIYDDGTLSHDCCANGGMKTLAGYHRDLLRPAVALELVDLLQAEDGIPILTDGGNKIHDDLKA